MNCKIELEVQHASLHVLFFVLRGELGSARYLGGTCSSYLLL